VRKEMKTIKHRWIIAFTFYWSWLVIALGSFTRLTDSGLSCPDWPGCYGKLYAGTLGSVVSHFRIWAEMSHRYAVLVLTLGILATLAVVVMNRRQVRPLQWLWVVLLLLLLFYQPVLGMWTVTLKLHPSIVSQHLLSGLSLMVLIGVQWLYFSDYFSAPVVIDRVRLLAGGGVVVLVLLYGQLFLGAWTSTNYAAVSCDSFPFCHLDAWSYRFHEAFNVLRPLGDNYSGGVVSEEARRTIQVVHRFGALVVGLCLLLWAGAVATAVKSPRLIGWALLPVLLLLIQVALGISIVYFSRPLVIALLHTLVAAGVLISTVALNYQVWCVKREISG
jgi:cytochrome c oxidase assembly protein subunit 15